ncbi:MAG TPA: hypothetical protein PLV68_11590, partial [Ilumatobacteraceae bacterium]|nr:hypothetical protein [Ilumatobacteraceae bacterium]
MAYLIGRRLRDASPRPDVYESARFGGAREHATMTEVPQFDTLSVALDERTGDDESADGRIGRLTLTQGDKLNPLGTVPLREIAAAARWFDTTSASVVIVTG